MLEGGLDKYKRFSVTRKCIVGDDESGAFIVDPLLDPFSGSLQCLRQLL